MPLLVSGAVKILREDFEEGELLLYFIEKGDTCAITLTTCINQSKSEIRATAETKGQVVMIPLEKMQEWLGKYNSWRIFIFNSYNNRLKEMLSAVDTIAFMNMEERLLHYLVDKAKINNSREKLQEDLKHYRMSIAYLEANVPIEVGRKVAFTKPYLAAATSEKVVKPEVLNNSVTFICFKAKRTSGLSEP